jgi:hypothetical protein
MDEIAEKGKIKRLDTEIPYRPLLEINVSGFVRGI